MGRVPDERRKGRCLPRGLNPVPARPRVTFHQDGDLPSGRGSSGFQTVDHLRVVGDNRNPCRFGKGSQPGQFRLSDNVEGDENVRHPGLGHDFGLAELLHGDSRCAQCQLMPRKRGHLVRLDMRSVRQFQPVAPLLPAEEIGLDGI